MLVFSARRSWSRVPHRLLVSACAWALTCGHDSTVGSVARDLTWQDLLASFYLPLSEFATYMVPQDPSVSDRVVESDAVGSHLLTDMLRPSLGRQWSSALC